jgi:L-fucose isomerase-like protein
MLYAGEKSKLGAHILAHGMSRALLIPVASPLHNSVAVRSILEEYCRCLGGEVDEVLHLITGREQLDRLEPIRDCLAVVVPLTGGTEHIIHMVFELVCERGFLLLAPSPMMNSLPAALESFSALRSSGRAWIIAEWPPGARIRRFMKAWRAIQGIRSMRIGLIGEPSPWLIYSSGSLVEEGLMSIFEGLTFVRISLEELYSKMDESPDSRLVDEVVGRAISLRVPRGDVERAMRVYLALKKLFEEHQLDAVSIRCFDLIGRVDTTACLAASLLNSELRIVGCEGDLPALITMLFFSKLTSSPSFMGNIAWIEDNIITIGHCSAPISMLRGFELDTHYESGRGVGVRGWFAEGHPVTLGRLDPVTRTLRYMVGMVMENAPSENACRTQLRVKVSGNVSTIIEEAIGNHYVVALGDLSEELRYVARILNVRLEEV